MTKDSLDKKPLLVRTLLGKKEKRLPVWMMRQAGRHLPEYIELRSRNKNFLDFCYAPAAAAEATLQPIRRYDLDAAIIFSDILVVPHALGQFVDFKEGIGPILEAIDTEEKLAKINNSKFETRLSPVYEALERVKEKLNPEQALYGFAGAPWTLATYMIQGKGGNREKARVFAFQNPEFMEKLFDLLIENIAQHLANQFKAGADVVQIFESWAEDLNEYSFQKWVIEPTQKLVARVRELVPNAPIIGFPRGASHRAKYYYPQTGVSGIGLDISCDLKTVRADLGPDVCVQGNLDPMALVVGSYALEQAVGNIIENAKTGPHIFNLGHGIVPQTPIENVQKMISMIRASEN